MSDENWPEIDPQDPNEQRRYLHALRRDFPKQTASIEVTELQRVVQEGLALCGPLDIKEPNDVVRFLALSFLITPQQRASKLLAQVYRRVLENMDLSARRRLAFLHHHFVGRQPPAREPDFGPWFVIVADPNGNVPNRRGHIL